MQQNQLEFDSRYHARDFSNHALSMYHQTCTNIDNDDHSGVCVCVCVCGCVRERERESYSEIERQSKTRKSILCVRVCMCLRFLFILIGTIISNKLDAMYLTTLAAELRSDHRNIAQTSL